MQRFNRAICFSLILLGTGRAFADDSLIPKEPHNMTHYSEQTVTFPTPSEPDALRLARLVRADGYKCNSVSGYHETIYIDGKTRDLKNAYGLTLITCIVSDGFILYRFKGNWEHHITQVAAIRDDQVATIGTN